MKTPLAALAALLFLYFTLAPSAQSQQGARTKFEQFTATNGHLVATNFIHTNLIVMKVTLIGKQAAGISNAAAVYVGPSTNAQHYLIGPGEVHIIETQPNTAINLKDWWLRATSAGDGLTIIYQ